jgi:transposase-like protein
LPAALTVRRADSTEVIGNALAAKADGAGFRTIAARLGRPASTVRRWLRRAPESHAQWLWERAVERAVQIDPELFARRAPQKTPLGHALNLLAGAAVRYRERLGLADAPWADRLLRPRPAARPALDQLTAARAGYRHALSAPSLRRTRLPARAGSPSSRRRGRHHADQAPIPRGHFQ